MKIYISGPITGLKPENYQPKFAAAAALIRSYDYTPVNPLEITSHLPEGTSWTEYMEVCLCALLRCDGILLLPDWQVSKGAGIEESVADKLGLKRYVLPNL